MADIILPNNYDIIAKLQELFVPQTSGSEETLYLRLMTSSYDEQSTTPDSNHYLEVENQLASDVYGDRSTDMYGGIYAHTVQYVASASDGNAHILVNYDFDTIFNYHQQGGNVDFDYWGVWDSTNSKTLFMVPLSSTLTVPELQKPKFTNGGRSSETPDPNVLSGNTGFIGDYDFVITLDGQSIIP